MSNSTNPPTNLSRSALEMVVDLFTAALIRPLDRNFVEFSLDVANSQLVVTSKEESASGEVGVYKGVYRWPYKKADLSAVLPHPLTIEYPYPMSFRQLRQQLLLRYQIHLEEGEVALSVGGPGLVDNDNLTTPLINQYAQFHLYATAQSGRFVEGTRMSLIFLQPGRRVPLRGLLDTIHSNPLNALVAG